MKQLDKLLEGVEGLEWVGEAATEIAGLSFDSRHIEQSFCFFAIRGTASDGHLYIDRAIEAGAIAVVCETLPVERREGITYARVEDANAAVARAATSFYGNPSRELKLVGVTGTNGKTTTATLLADLFKALGYATGLISTVVYRVGERTIPSTHTTPDALRLNAMLREMVDSGVEYCFMEVSSHAIAQKRVEGLHFAGAIFSNLTHDHLDYHHTFAEYLRVKKSLFDQLPKEAFALVNIDDRNGRVMVQNTRARVATYSLRSVADFHCRILEMHFDGMLLKVGEQELWVNQLGRFNAYNLLSIYATAILLGASTEEVLCALTTLRSVDGRFEAIPAQDGTVALVDYAHTPDALENVLQTIEEIRRPNQRLFVVCGCGGDRDRTKRPEMAAIALKYATCALFTSDNPRSESPEAILDEMTQGIPASARYIREADRSRAIFQAVMLSHPGDIILVAGKGHETYQIIGDRKEHFDDREEVRRAFEAKAKSAAMIES